jgi:hypothetical protein
VNIDEECSYFDYFTLFYGFNSGQFSAAFSDEPFIEPCSNSDNRD